MKTLRLTCRALTRGRRRCAKQCSPTSQGPQPPKVLSPRYFNPVRADPKMLTGVQLSRPTDALGQMIRGHLEGVPFVIIGTDWPTRDGTGFRDYVHVWNLAGAQVAALTQFDSLPNR